MDDVAAGAALTNSISVEVAKLPGDPEVSSVDTPVVPVVCPDIVISGVGTTVAGSGAVSCSLTFDVFSADATTLTVTSVTNTALSAGAAVTYDAFPIDVTNASGTRVAWTGGFATPECQNAFASDVVFTVTATCDGAIDPITADFTLADIAAMA